MILLLVNLQVVKLFESIFIPLQPNTDTPYFLEIVLPPMYVLISRNTVVFLVLSTGHIVILLGLKVIPSIYILHLVQSPYPLAKL